MNFIHPTQIPGLLYPLEIFASSYPAALGLFPCLDRQAPANGKLQALSASFAEKKGGHDGGGGGNGDTLMESSEALVVSSLRFHLYISSDPCCRLGPDAAAAVYPCAQLFLSVTKEEESEAAMPATSLSTWQRRSYGHTSHSHGLRRRRRIVEHASATCTRPACGSAVATVAGGCAVAVAVAPITIRHRFILADPNHAM